MIILIGSVMWYILYEGHCLDILHRCFIRAALIHNEFMPASCRGFFPFPDGGPTVIDIRNALNK